MLSMFFFFNDTATTEIYTLSLHDALPIYGAGGPERARPAPQRRRLRPVGRGCAGALRRHRPGRHGPGGAVPAPRRAAALRDRKSTRLNSSHANISYAVFCLKKKKKQTCTQ